MEIQDNETRLFFVVDSFNDTEELFVNYGEALKHYEQLTDDGKRIYIAAVANYYLEGAHYSYDAQLNTFTLVKVIK